MTNILRADWERRWAAAPELRPVGLEWSPNQVCFPGWWHDVRHDEAGIAPDHAAALICWRAVEYIVERGREVAIDTDEGRFSVRVSAIRPTFKAATLIDALGAAVDAVLEARK